MSARVPRIVEQPRLGSIALAPLRRVPRDSDDEPSSGRSRLEVLGHFGPPASTSLECVDAACPRCGRITRSVAVVDARTPIDGETAFVLWDCYDCDYLGWSFLSDSLRERASEARAV
jgi:hypothetical protein